METILFAIATDWEVFKVIVGGGVGVFAIWTLGKIAVQMLGMIQARDLNQMSRDDKRDLLLTGMKETISAQDATFKKLHEGLDEAMDESKRRWVVWDEDRMERARRARGDQ